MFNIEENNIIGQTNKLLFDILEELKRLNDFLMKNNIPKQDESEAKEVKENNVLTCKICGAKHDNKGKLMACYRKHKREGTK